MEALKKKMEETFGSWIVEKTANYVEVKVFERWVLGNPLLEMRKGNRGCLAGLKE